MTNSLSPKIKLSCQGARILYQIMEDSFRVESYLPISVLRYTIAVLFRLKGSSNLELLFTPAKSLVKG